ncbi:MAG: Mov34/MPN/PAD-1 family protein [Candidatus Heimdallarchaeota archaeon]
MTDNSSKEENIDNTKDESNQRNLNNKSDNLSDSLKLNDLSATSRLIEKYGIDPAKTPVFLKYNAYRRMVGYAIRYANEDISIKNWREVYGILIGSIENNRELVVKDAIPRVVGDRAGVKYENKQYVDMAEIDESVHERSIRDQKNDFIIGWWHTHPGFGFFFSPIDCLTQLGYQIPNPFAVGLIFDHCEKLSDKYYLGIASLRLMNPEQGTFSTYNIIELKSEFETTKMVNKVEKIVKDIKKNLSKVLKEVKYIDETLRKRALAQLQRNYGLILVPKRDIKITENEEEAEEDDKFLYEWDPEFFKKSYRIPKFREKLEMEIKKYENLLIDIKKSNDSKKFNQKKEKFRKKIQSHLSKPNEWYNKLMDEFTKRIEIISPYFDYLDTDERKIIEYFETKISDYNRILDNLNIRAEFNLKD